MCYRTQPFPTVFNTIPKCLTLTPLLVANLACRHIKREKSTPKASRPQASRPTESNQEPTKANRQLTSQPAKEKKKE